jgi:hypothetical protein
MDMDSIDLASLEADPYAEHVSGDILPPEPAPDPQYDEATEYGAERRKLIRKISQYLSTFPEKLKDYQRANLEKLSTEELQKMLEELDYVLGCRNTIGVATQAFIQGVSAAEYVACNFTPIRAQGFAQACLDQELLDDVKLVMLQNMDNVSTKPEQRIAYRLVSTLLLVHVGNTQRDKISAAPMEEEQPDPNKISATKTVKLEKLQEKYGDL